MTAHIQLVLTFVNQNQNSAIGKKYKRNMQVTGNILSAGVSNYNTGIYYIMYNISKPIDSRLEENICNISNKGKYPQY